MVPISITESLLNMDLQTMAAYAAALTLQSYIPTPSDIVMMRHPFERRVDEVKPSKM